MVLVERDLRACDDVGVVHLHLGAVGQPLEGPVGHDIVSVQMHLFFPSWVEVQVGACQHVHTVVREAEFEPERGADPGAAVSELVQGDHNLWRDPQVELLTFDLLGEGGARVHETEVHAVSGMGEVERTPVPAKGCQVLVALVDVAFDVRDHLHLDPVEVKPLRLRSGDFLG